MSRVVCEQPFLPLSDVTWIEVHDANDTGRALFHRHYSYAPYRDGRRPLKFVGPGENMVLLTVDAKALFVWRKFISAANQHGINCSIFRNEGPRRSSDLIREADQLAWERWPGERHYTYVNPRKVRSTNPGCCFLKAGWRKCGITQKRKYLILEILPERTRMKQKVKTANPTIDVDLTIVSTPPILLDFVRNGNAGTLATRDVNVLYTLADFFEKTLKALKDKCRPVIISRRDEGEVTGSQAQHRQFKYDLPTGNVQLIVQERLIQKPDPEKLEELLRTKNLWEQALTTTLDPIKVDGMRVAGLITDEEYASVSDSPRPTYALIARFDAKKS